MAEARAAGRWFARAVFLVGAVTAARVVLLAFDRTDLFVDEAQYWLWGQVPDFGYYSKPPLIAWLIGAVTWVSGSDAPFWVRLPGAFLHAATALVLGTLAARLSGPRAAVWVAVSYVTLPMAALGSLMISADTVMAPFFALALVWHFRLVETGQGRFAVLAGVAAGLAFLAKYAAVYLLLGAALAALLVPMMRIAPRHAVLMLATFALTILPNLWWNLTHGMATLSHTADNVGWIGGGGPGVRLNLAGLAEFFASQFAVIGPVLMAALIWGWIRPAGPVARALRAFSLPVLVLVCLQAVLSKAYGNWAIAAYFPGLLIAVPLLVARAPRLLVLSLALNGVICLALPVLTITAPAPVIDARPLLARYLGRADLSRQIIDAAGAAGVTAVVAANRDILADLHYTGRDAGLAVFAPRPGGRPRNYYQQVHPLPDPPPPALYVLEAAPDCGAGPLDPVVVFDTAGGAYRSRALAGYLLPSDCADAAR